MLTKSMFADGCNVHFWLARLCRQSYFRLLPPAVLVPKMNPWPNLFPLEQQMLSKELQVLLAIQTPCQITLYDGREARSYGSVCVSAAPYGTNY